MNRDPYNNYAHSDLGQAAPGADDDFPDDHVDDPRINDNVLTWYERIELKRLVRRLAGPTSSTEDQASRRDMVAARDEDEAIQDNDAWDYPDAMEDY